MMYLPFYRKPAEMIPKHILLMLSVLQSVSLSHEFSVEQPKTQAINADGTVTIACEHYGSDSSWRMQGALKRKHDDSTVCLVSDEQDLIQNDKKQCRSRNSSWNKLEFTFHVEAGNETVYECEFIKMIPPPVLLVRGKGTTLVSAPVQVCPSVPAVPQCPEPSLLNWVLMGLAGFLLLCCIAVTCAYIRLRVKQGKDMDAMTYVSMQPPQPHVEYMRRGDPESNTTYMDMRKMQLQGRTSRRDMNYNSQPMNY
ncbi:hypothetical protein SKAU_G00258600 [Synaphobranchus kaupii]|uniref:Uncharacterized protein n=1 Tax=Synaphobranchus kaupii TaxID=118154 RepID=A0A9Q1F4A5_SYNKA|nr:hypothetical protein SKAU_G00258600 [Synaphobranchus kaupii]